MASNADVINRADSLMHAESAPLGGRRRRTFVAAPAQGVEPPMEHPFGEDEDLPVLTEVVATAAETLEVPKEHLDDARVSALAEEIAQAIGQQMAFELPTLLEATLLNASEELRNGITSTIEIALRDFMARRKQLRLPLDEQDTDI
jgi:hypothetical protein